MTIKTLHILILEDNPADAELIQFKLGEAGIVFTAKVVMTREDFIHELRAFSPDIILSAYDLRQYNCSFAFAETQRRCPEIPFILMAGTVLEDPAIEILTQGARDYVLKARLEQRLGPAVRRAVAEAVDHKARKKAEDEIRPAPLYSGTPPEANLAPLVTISPVGKIAHVNKAAEEDTGVSRDQIIGADVELREAQRELETKVRERTTELRKEIEDRERTEIDLRRSAATLRGILDASEESIWLVSTEGFMLMGNPTALRRFGKPAEEIIGKHINAIFSPGLADSRLTHLKQTLASRKANKFEDERNGIIFRHHLYPVFDDNGNVNSVVCFSRDITERRHTEEALRENEERHRLLWETMSQGVVHLDSGGKIISMNPAAERILGKSPEEYLSETSANTEHHTLREDGSLFPGWEHPAMVALRTGQPLRGVVMGVFNPREKVYRWIRIDALPLFRPEEDCPFQVYAVFEDITASKQAEKELIKHAAELEAINKERESFSHSVSHDLRAPLRAIDGYLRMILLRQGDQFDEETKRQFEQVRNSTRAMGQLIDGLLALSKLSGQDLDIKIIDIRELIEKTWQELQSGYPGRDVTLKMNHLPPVSGDRTLMKQVFVNLLSNAIKFTRTRNAALIEVGGYEKENEIVYSVKDNGIGFDMKDHDKLFGIFQRLHSAAEYEGTGIGLSLIQRIIHRHGGRVWAEGKVNEGATFYFTLPIKV